MAKTPKAGQKIRIKPQKKGQKALTFTKGNLHTSTNTPQGQKISNQKMMMALAGKLGPKAAKQARFAKNVLAKGQRTAARHRRNT